MVGALAVLVLLQSHNTLTPEEAKAGWRLLFDGRTTAGWKSFGGGEVKPGWKVVDGVLTIAEPSQAGDIVTAEKFDWFELKLDFNVGKGQNSGIMFHVADTGDATWHSGPEVQIYDDGGAKGAERTGWLYQLYPSKVDATKPAGEWNSMRILVTPTHCETAINGVKYYEYVLGSDDFKARLAKSKFAGMPAFAKARIGSIAIQGDHGNVSFRSIKIRPIKAQARP